MKLIVYDTGQRYVYEIDPENPPDWLTRHTLFSTKPSVKEKEEQKSTLPENISTHGDQIR